MKKRLKNKRQMSDCRNIKRENDDNSYVANRRFNEALLYINKQQPFVNKEEVIQVTKPCLHLAFDEATKDLAAKELWVTYLLASGSIFSCYQSSALYWHRMIVLVFSTVFFLLFVIYSFKAVKFYRNKPFDIFYTNVVSNSIPIKQICYNVPNTEPNELKYNNKNKDDAL